MVGKKSGKALLREEGLERTDNGMDLTSWPVVPAINQKNYYVDFLKRDEQFLAIRTQQEDARNRMVKQAKDRDRALAQGRQLGPDGDVDMSEGEDEAEDELSAGTKTIVIHPGSQNLRIGLASDIIPKSVPMVIAKKATHSESEDDFAESIPKRRKLSNGSIEPVAEKRLGQDFADTYVAASTELKLRMRMNKRKVLPQSRDMVTSYNKRAVYDTINEHNDTARIDWTDVSAEPNAVAGRAALRIPDQSKPRYKLYRPIQNGWLNEKDYSSIQSIYDDIRAIVEDAARTELKLDLSRRSQRSQYNCVLIIPDYYERNYVIGLLHLAIHDMGFSKVCFIQESLAASFGAGFMSGCVVDVGAQKTSICCVEDGMVLENSRVNMKYGGHDVTDMFVKMIMYNWFPYADINLKRRHDFLLSEELKQRFSTLQEADISVQLYEFYLRAPGQDTRKYSFKIYDEVALPSLMLFNPRAFDSTHKLAGRRKLLPRSYDFYDGKANDPLSMAQQEIIQTTIPSEIVNARPIDPSSVNGTSDHSGTNGVSGTQTAPDAQRETLPQEEGTPLPSGASSPARRTPPPAAALNGLTNGEHDTPMPEDVAASDQPAQQQQQPPAPAQPQSQHQSGAPKFVEAHVDVPYPWRPVLPERRDDLLPMAPLHVAVMSSINHAARGSAQKTHDLYGSIYLIGGASKVSGMSQHLEESLKAELGRIDGAQAYVKDVLVNRPPRDLDPEMVVWKGGAVFGRMGRTNDSWINSFLYERLGERVLANKLMWAW